MARGSDFVDYYDLLKVDPDCDARTLEVAYHSFAKLYHPDSVDTADVEKFGEIIDAYKILRDSEKRANYDRDYSAALGKPQKQPPLNGNSGLDEQTAIGDAQIHAAILFQLYKKRRERAADPGVVAWLLQESLGCTDDQFEFHVWYLKSKGLLEITEHGTLAITIDGVDHVISTSRETAKQRLLTAQTERSPGQP